MSIRVPSRSKTLAVLAALTPDAANTRMSRASRLKTYEKEILKNKQLCTERWTLANSGTLAYGGYREQIAAVRERRSICREYDEALDEIRKQIRYLQN